MPDGCSLRDPVTDSVVHACLPVHAAVADSYMPPDSARSRASGSRANGVSAAGLPAGKGGAPSHAESAKFREVAGSYRYDWVQELVKRNEEPGALVCTRTAEILQVGGHSVARRSRTSIRGRLLCRVHALPSKTPVELLSSCLPHPCVRVHMRAVCVLCLRASGHVQVNERFATIFGYSAERLLEKKVGKFGTGRYTEVL